MLFKNVFIIFLIIFLEIIAINFAIEKIPSYLAKIHQLRDAIQQRNFEDNGDDELRPPKKPKKYKCILIDDDNNNDENEEFFSLTTTTNLPKTITTTKEWITISANTPSFVAEIPANNEQSFKDQPTNMIVDEKWNDGATNSIEQKQLDENSNNDYTTPLTPLIRTSLVKPLKQILLPRATGIPLKKFMENQQNLLNQQQLFQQQQNYEPQQNYEQQQQQQSIIPSNVMRDAQNRPLILSPEHCKMIMHYASLYQVKDVKSWVHKNCAFAKMYLPDATCAEIDILVNSCAI